jgi:hypothetical protein
VTSLSRPTAAGRDARPTAAARSAGQPGRMTNNAHIAHEADDIGNAVSRMYRQVSPHLSASAVGITAVGIVTGVIEYLHRSPIREAHLPGTSAWTPHLVVAAVAGALYGVARWRHGRRFGRGSGRLLLLAPLGKSAASRLMATTRQVSWRSAAALPPLALIGYSLWRVGEQVIGGLDPNFTANAWGGPSYLGAMACHYLDAALMIGVGAWLLDKILPSAVAAERSAAPRQARRVRAVSH